MTNNVDVDRARQAVHQVMLAMTHMYAKCGDEHHFLRPIQSRDDEVVYPATLQGMSTSLLHKVYADDGVDLDAKIRVLEILSTAFKSYNSPPGPFSYQSNISPYQDIVEALGRRFDQLLKVDQKISADAERAPPSTSSLRQRR